MADKAPGAGFTVTGTLSEVDIETNLAGTTLTGVGGTFTLKVLDAGGAQLASVPVTAAGNGTFSANVPGSATTGVDPGPGSGFRTTLGLRAVDAGGIANARYLEAITALLLNLNRRHHARTSIAILGLP